MAPECFRPCFVGPLRAPAHNDSVDRTIFLKIIYTVPVTFAYEMTQKVCGNSSFSICNNWNCDVRKGVQEGLGYSPIYLRGLRRTRADFLSAFRRIRCRNWLGRAFSASSNSDHEKSNGATRRHLKTPT